MEWQPIETAPRDRPCIVFGLQAGEISGIASDPSVCIAEYTGRGDYPGFDWSLCDGDAYAVWVKPSHWMPLPPPPSLEG